MAAVRSVPSLPRSLRRTAHSRLHSSLVSTSGRSRRSRTTEQYTTDLLSPGQRPVGAVGRLTRHADRAHHGEARGHVIEFGKTRFGKRAAAIGGLPRAAWRKAAARRQAPQIGRAARDSVDVALTGLAV